MLHTYVDKYGKDLTLERQDRYEDFQALLEETSKEHKHPKLKAIIYLDGRIKKLG